MGDRREVTTIRWPLRAVPSALDDFPRTASGKVQKFRLRQQLRDGALGGGPQPR